MLTNWCDSWELCELFNRMTSEGNYEWVFRDLDGETRRLRMTADDDEPDFWAVINSPPPGEESRIDPSRTVVFQMEPLMATDAMRGRWGRWAAPSPLSFLQVRDHGRYRNSCDWWIGLTHSELSTSPPPEKTRAMAACVSEKYFDPGHRKRVDFLHFLDGEDLDVDIYGHAGHGFRRYRGRTPPHDKRSCLLPYRYYFDAENNSAPNFFTEKIVDCLLAETLCFYWGCPNLESYFDPRAFIRLELTDFAADLQRIREAIAADEWSRRLPFIQAEKRRILDDYGFFPTLARSIDPSRRRPRRDVDGVGRNLVNRWIGDRRCGTFVEISDRSGPADVSETLDVERRLDWTGICLEARDDRVRAARSIRDCIVAAGEGGAIDVALTRNAIAPNTIDWLNLAVTSPSDLLREGGRLNPSSVRANLISMPLADASERQRCGELLAPLGYGVGDGEEEEELVLLRDGRDDVFGFYHLYTLNSWREIAGQQTERMQRSGLADRTRRIFASVVGPDVEEGCALLREAFGDRVEVVFQSVDPSRSERPILEHARRFCEQDEPLARAVWYVHAKGVSTNHRGNPNVTDWRRFMDHFVIDGWRESLDSLGDHDACGVNWHHEPEPHFSGNCWWASPRYVATLPKTIGAMPFDQEAWIGRNQPRVRSLHESGVDHYLEPYPENLYR
jgi:hypothetical protein